MRFKIQKNNISTFEVFGYALILMGIIILVWGVQQFNLFGRVEGKSPEELGIRFGQYGEFIGGIVGSLWALAGVFLFFATLLYQKREFQLQRTELHKTQRIYQQQSFSTLFISFLVQHNDIVGKLSAYDINQAPWNGTNFFIFFKEKVLSSYIGKVRLLPKEQRTEKLLYAYFRDYFTYHFRFYESSLNPYLRNLTVLLNMIERFRQDADDESDYYSLIMKTNLSDSELFLIYHLNEFGLLPEIKEAVEHYDLFQHLPAFEKVYYQVQTEKI
ncbi:hypothetical protein I5M27_09095 [Adhaeribacter sp. BT258]|uniref:Phage abortive infection protein n=1 Tax=Adhaeribacter terrigena TaxID=2793070 RepID=A0ABS1C1C9_9BACT|nr:putative phage abortive infection protein [Adhaeribacter terrigena]MBK0403139.1 hypothetical protein [Adhaeribacter terrigena]